MLGPRSWRESFAERGFARLVVDADRMDGLTPPLAGWRKYTGDGSSFDLQDGSPQASVAMTSVLATVGMHCEGRSVWLRHGSGDYGLRRTAEGLATAILDFTADWRSPWGGLLLFSDDANRVEGWRPERGALTLFRDDRAPLLTLVAPGVPWPRVSLTMPVVV